MYTARKITIEQVMSLLSKYISESAIDIQFSPDAGNNTFQSTQGRQ